MDLPVSNQPPGNGGESKLKDHLLPSLLRAGHLFCGFVALTKILAVVSGKDFGQIKLAAGFILLGCVFDLLHDRITR